MSGFEKDEELDLGEIEPGQSPDHRHVKPGVHPWAPSAIDKYPAHHEDEREGKS